MKNGKCPKCESTDILHVAKRYPEPRGVVGVTLWSRVPVDDYVCGACGYRETYLSEFADLYKIRKAATASPEEGQE